MEACFTDTIEGHCGGLECRVFEVEQKIEERLVSLKMVRTKVETWRADLEKQFDGLRLEVGRLNRFMESKSMAHPPEKHDISSTHNLVWRLVVRTLAMRICPPRIVKLGQMSPIFTFRALVCLTQGFPIAMLSLHRIRVVLARVRVLLSPFVLVRVNCLRFCFCHLVVRIPSCGSRVARVTLRCTLWSPICGLRWSLFI
jgi:hypothetical protein